MAKSKNIKNKHGNKISVISLSITVIIFFIFTGYIAWSHSKLQALINASKANEKNLDSIKNNINSLKIQLSLSQTQSRKTATDIEKSLEDHEIKLSYLLDLLNEQLSFGEEKSAPQSFSFYESAEWTQKKNDTLSSMRLSDCNVMRDDGYEEQDRVNIKESGEVLIDSLDARAAEAYDTFNGEPNSIFIAAPGLAALKDRSLEIGADKDLDQIILDGCLKWDISKENDGKEEKTFVAWTATDNKGEKRTVRIMKDVPASIAPTCDNRYLILRKTKTALPPATEKSKSPTKSRVSSNLAFGGIGIRFTQKKDEIFINEVLPGKPAEKAGMKKGDRILKIDGTALTGLNDEEILLKMRGDVNSTALLTYKKYDTGDIVDIPVTRVLIEHEQPFAKMRQNTKDIDRETIRNPEQQGRTKKKNCGAGKTSADSRQSEIDQKPIDYESVPPHFRSEIRENMNMETYLYAIETRFVSASGGKNLINADLIMEHEARALNNVIKQQKALMYKYDSNFDQKITRDEIVETMRDNNPRISGEPEAVRKVRVNQIMKIDQDGNNIITEKETQTLNHDHEQKLKEKNTKSFDAYLRMDPNNDGTLTLDEYKDLARESFILIDLNKDNVISHTEYIALRNSRFGRHPNKTHLPQ